MLTITIRNKGVTTVSVTSTLSERQCKKNPKDFFPLNASRRTRTAIQKQFDHFNFSSKD